MYYVSRITPTYIYVTDTTDNVEEKLTRSDFWEYISQGIQIMGVQGNYIQMKNGRYKVDSYEIKVYNPNPTAFEAKLSFMSGIVVSVSEDGTLTNFDNKVENNEIRLSTFCSSLGAYCINRSGGAKCTLIFDSGIKHIDSRAFNNNKYFKIRIEDGTDSKVVKQLYNCIMKQRGKFTLSIYVQDCNPNRLAYYQFENLMTSAHPSDTMNEIVSSYFNGDNELYLELAHNYYKRNKKKILKFFEFESMDKFTISNNFFIVNWLDKERVSLSNIKNFRKFQSYSAKDKRQLLLKYNMLKSISSFLDYSNINSLVYKKAYILFKVIDDDDLTNTMFDFMFKISSLYHNAKRV